VQRVIAKLHRILAIKGYDQNEFCEAKVMPIIKKSLYKTQMVHPTAQTSGICHPLGKSDLLWGAGKSFPKTGEDFVYLIWTKKQCCLDAVKPVAAGVAL
jgi:conjugal transfer pilus assembly protein TraU